MKEYVGAAKASKLASERLPAVAKATAKAAGVVLVQVVLQGGISSVANRRSVFDRCTLTI